jgi:aminoglycoside phosphotransferase (APT) family kinase protein
MFGNAPMTPDPSTPQMHEDEVLVDEGTVRALLRDQFPQWADKRLHRIADSGTDNAIYRLGDEQGIRLPRIHWAEAQIEKECRWLSKLAEDLPAAVPVPLAEGRPGHGYPFPWLVYPWLEGTSLDQSASDDWSVIAEDVAEFVLALEMIPPDGGPAPTRRGTPMAQFDEAVQWGIDQLVGVVDVDRARHVWRSALEAGDWPEDLVWVHGDLLPGNILVSNGRLSGIIDWSCAGVGDPACEAMLAWSLPQDARRIYRNALGLDDATWARARGWVVEQTVFYIPYYAKTLPLAVHQAVRRLNEALMAD